MSRGRVLVVEDKDSMRRLLARILSDDFEVVEAADGLAAKAVIAGGGIDVVLTDVQMPGADGLALLEFVRSCHPDLEVVMVTAYGSVHSAVEALKSGAFDYLTKPFEPDEVTLTMRRAWEHKQLRDRARNLSAELDRRSGFEQLIGESAEMRQVYALIDKVADRDTTVLVAGDSGTGKELIARAIHRRGRRREGPFVAVNCGAIPESLLESELFGHAKAAFTGATAARRGLLEESAGGTLFLDEIDSMPLELQVALNRVLQERTVRRVGESRDVAIDLRVIAGTNADLEALVGAGKFRADLFYRLNVYPIRVPPLRERAGDIPLLVAHFLGRHADPGRDPLEVSPEALRVLLRYSWPGNVRELENVIERAVILEESPSLTTASLPTGIVHGSRVDPAGVDPTAVSYREAIELARDRVSREYLRSILEMFEGNVTQAAERAGMERESLHRLLRRYGLRAEDYRRSGDPEDG